MLTFLPRTYRIEVEREYRRRVYAVAAWLLALLMLVGAALVLPTYARLSSEKAAAEAALRAASQSAGGDASLVDTRLADLQDKAKALDDLAARRSLVWAVERVAAAREQAGVSITGLGIKRGGGAGSISVSGTASSREALVAFTKALQAEPSFKDVSLPVSALAKSVSLPFSLGIDTNL
ncbi:MAG TPA: hypothetical protein VFQ72_02210 [Candidatus Paceibacterota bacterium]|nr:hypothetical protein [Candidatus Paceibacterota bacterium]